MRRSEPVSSMAFAAAFAFLLGAVVAQWFFGYWLAAPFLAMGGVLGVSTAIYHAVKLIKGEWR